MDLSWFYVSLIGGLGKNLLYKRAIGPLNAVKHIKKYYNGSFLYLYDTYCNVWISINFYDNENHWRELILLLKPTISKFIFLCLKQFI